MNVKELNVLEWSETQKKFHNSTLVETANAGQEAFVRRASTDWIVVGVFETVAERDAFKEEICLKRGLEWDEENREYVDVNVESN